MSQRLLPFQEGLTTALETVLMHAYKAKATIPIAYYPLLVQQVSDVAQEVIKKPASEISRDYINLQRTRLIKIFKGLPSTCSSLLREVNWETIPGFNKFNQAVFTVSSLEFHLSQVPTFMSRTDRANCEVPFVRICHDLMKIQEWPFVEQAFEQVSDKWEQFWLLIEWCKLSYENGSFIECLRASIRLKDLLTTLNPISAVAYEVCLEIVALLQRLAYVDHARRLFDHVKETIIQTSTAREELDLYLKAAHLAFELKDIRTMRQLLDRAEKAISNYGNDLSAIDKLIHLCDIYMKFNEWSQVERCLKKTEGLVDCQKSCPEWLSQERWESKLNRVREELQAMRERFHVQSLLKDNPFHNGK